MTSINNNTQNPNEFIDSSIVPKKGQLGYVDKSFITSEEEGKRLGKIIEQINKL